MSIRSAVFKQLIVYSVVMFSAQVVADTRLEIETLTLEGQLELPAQRFEVPWQRNPVPSLPIPNAEAAAPLRPVDPEQFRRWLKLRTAQPGAAKRE